MTSADIENTETWLPLDGLEPGFSANRAPHSRDLDGRKITVRLEDGTAIRHEFGPDTVDWAIGEENGSDEYEAFEVDSGLYFVQFLHRHDPRQAVSLVLDLTGGHALAVLGVIGEPERRPTVVSQRFDVGTIEGCTVTGAAPAPTAELLGRRMLWQYSPTHRYEHVYLTEHWYTFHCLSGPEQGLADTDACTYYRIRPGIFVFAWREKVVPCAAVTIADHRNFGPGGARSHGALFGLHEDGKQIVHFTFGAYGRLLSTTVYPDTVGD
ncbi:MoaF C-terminal domain-containing protein [Sciscionella marina]|uniref:MoaF C-terminal domain-containing protein n=1 Tax=Sciscionella marina TaxID=508770 RepID=UPI000360F82A|nr:MoaF C-terminal domain-containing protein [Sciscionella marina]